MINDRVFFIFKFDFFVFRAKTYANLFFFSKGGHHKKCNTMKGHLFFYFDLGGQMILLNSFFFKFFASH